MDLSWLQGVTEQLLQKNLDAAVKTGEADKGDEPLQFHGFTGKTLVDGPRVRLEFRTKDPLSGVEDTLLVTLDLNDGVVWLCTQSNSILDGASMMLDATKLRR